MMNEEIRVRIKKYRLFQYEVAEMMGISESYLATLLRKPLSADMKRNVEEAIEKLTNNE